MAFFNSAVGVLQTLVIALRELAERTISKVNALTDAEYKELSVYPADEV